MWKRLTESSDDQGDAKPLLSEDHKAEMRQGKETENTGYYDVSDHRRIVFPELIALVVCRRGHFDSLIDPGKEELNEKIVEWCLSRVMLYNISSRRTCQALYRSLQSLII